MYSFQRDDGQTRSERVILTSHLGVNSVTADEERYVLVRLGGNRGGTDGEFVMELYAMPLEMASGLIGLICEQARRDNRSHELLHLIAADLRALRDSRHQAN